MQIASSTDKISSTSNRLVDLNNYMLINSVPYLKENNSPIPFNIVDINSTQNFCHGKTMNPTDMDMLTSTTDWGSILYENNRHNSKNNNMIVDNKDNSIIYIMTSFDIDPSGSYSSTKSRTLKLYKLKIQEDKTISILTLKDIVTTQTTTIPYITQDNDNLYIMLYTGTSSYSLSSGSTTSGNSSILHSNRGEMRKIDKETLNISSCSLYDMLYTGVGYFYYSSSSAKYLRLNMYDAFPVVLYEIPNEGLILYINSYNNWTGDGYSYSGGKCRYNIHTYYYSFATNTVTKIELFSPSGPQPKTSNGWNKDLAYRSLDSSSRNENVTAVFCPMSYPNYYLETDNELYQYFVSPSDYASGYSMVAHRMFQSKEDLMSISFSDVELIFPEDNEYGITALPAPSLGRGSVYANYNDTCGQYFINQYGYWYETFTQNVNGIDYMHVCYKGDYANPNVSRGIYTFKINEDKTAATLVSFYEALGGSFRDFMFLKEDRSRILVATATSYHILNFDPISESWISSYDSLQTVKSFLHTKEDKLYAILSDDRIICQDLNGAVMIDFEFEKPVYNYNNTDINSYITIWAKNADEEYTATNIKLTLTGNVVWQANGLQTLETTTSADGPINIPFVIKGHTAINVGVDAII